MVCEHRTPYALTGTVTDTDNLVPINVCHFSLVCLMPCAIEHEFVSFHDLNVLCVNTVESLPILFIIQGLEDPRALIDNRGSFKNYREAFAQAKPPCIPYM